MSSDVKQSGGNDEQIAHWNAPGGGRWAQLAATMDALIEPFGLAAMEAAEVRVGDRVVDVGCGCGATLLALADRAGETGTVVGVDVSAPMLEVARERTAGRANVKLVQADASDAPLADASHDLLFSRFGVMFFADPSRSFRALARALAPGARVAFVCWRPLRDNDWARVPLEAVLPFVGPMERPAPEAPGPFSFGDPERVRRILGEAGLGDVRIEPFDHPMSVGASADLDAAVDHAMGLGPASRALTGADDDTLSRARAALRTALAPYHSARGVTLRSGAWIVTARQGSGR